MIEDFLQTVADFIRDENEMTDRPSLTQTDIERFLALATPSEKAKIARIERQGSRIENEDEGSALARQVQHTVYATLLAHDAVDTLLSGAEDRT
ncbi:MAG: hypothetical protein ACOYB3_00525 [Azonexus sp.]